MAKTIAVPCVEAHDFNFLFLFLFFDYFVDAVFLHDDEQSNAVVVVSPRNAHALSIACMYMWIRAQINIWCLTA